MKEIQTSVLCSIIIRSYNEEKHIGKLMEGIKRQTLFISSEVILVDSGSTDNTVLIAKSYGARIVSIKPEDFSFGRALNIGCAQAKGEFLLLASAHVYPVYTDWIEKMLAPFSNERVALCYGRQIGNEVTKYSEHRIFEKWFPGDSNYNQQHPFCNNANAVIRKTLWKEQEYDELLTGLEDLDWALKIQKKGYNIAYEAHAPIVHVHEENFDKIKNRYMREAIALKRILPSEKFSFFKFARLVISNIISDLVHAIHDKQFFRRLREIMIFRTLQFWGTYQGFRASSLNNSQLRQRFYYPNGLKKKSKADRPDAEKIQYELC